MKRWLSAFLAVMLLGALTACGEGGLNLNPNGNQNDDDDSDTKYGYIGDTMSTEWFDFVVGEAYSCAKYGNYTAGAGNKLVVATITLKNDCGQSVDMWGDDFVILWDDPDEDSGLDIPLPAGISADQFPDEYSLGINASRTGKAVFEVPEEFRDFAIAFQEVYEVEDNPDGEVGKTFFVSFTAEEQ